MAIRSVSFDDEDGEELCVFSGYDLLISHYDVADLDWQEVAERSALDERRGLVIAQVAVLEDLIDEFLTYLADPADPEEFQRDLGGMTIGPRIKCLEKRLDGAALLDDAAADLIQNLRSVVDRRNELAHGTLYRRPTKFFTIEELRRAGDLDLEWLIFDRKSRTSKRISMAGLRQDLYEATECVSAMLAYAEAFVERAPRPTHFPGGSYLAVPTP